jgi:hypothetical protein
VPSTPASQRYAKVIDASRRVQWEIDRDVIRGRRFDHARCFLPTGLSLANELDFLTPADRRLLSQVQGRTYAYMFCLVERFISIKAGELGRGHFPGDPVAMAALAGMTQEEIKHQELFRRLEAQMAQDMPAGYAQTADADAVAAAVLGKHTWAVLALTLHIELFVQAHYRNSIDRSQDICPLWKDVFLFHWREESQHAILDELELLREDAKMLPGERDRAVDDLIALVGAVDGILQQQSKADAQYFARSALRPFNAGQQARIEAQVLKAYRWQYIVSGVMEPRFQRVLFGLLDESQAARIQDALQPLTYAVPAEPETPLPLAA